MHNRIGTCAVLAAVAIVLGVALAACSTEPVYRTQYTLTPPSSAQGRTCVATCQGNQQLCIGNARAEVQKCEADRRHRQRECLDLADQNYRSCLSRIRYGNASSRQTQRQSCESSQTLSRSNCTNRYYANCSPDSDCDGQYRNCFRLCGGQVQARRVCVRNCDKR